MFCTMNSLGLTGIEPYMVSVEVDVRRGLPGFEIVGLPDTAVKESRDRVKSAIQNLGYQLPQYKIVANLAPADTKKIGSVYDLPILLGLIAASGYEQLEFGNTAIVGEIGLSGEVRGVPGVLPMVLDARRLGLSRVIVPMQNAAEAAVVQDVEVLCAAHAREVVAFLRGDAPLAPASGVSARVKAQPPLPDLADVKGQEEARRPYPKGGPYRGGPGRRGANRRRAYFPGRSTARTGPEVLDALTAAGARGASQVAAKGRNNRKGWLVHSLNNGTCDRLFIPGHL